MAEGHPTLRTATGTLNVERYLMVGALNATSDSFPDSGDRSTAESITKALAHLDSGASTIEVGGESNLTNRPAEAAEREIRREPVAGTPEHGRG